MKSKITCFIFIFVCALLETSVFSFLKLFYAQPNLLLMALVFSGIAFKWRWAVTFAFFAGLMQDSVGGVNSFGINTLLFFFWILLVIRILRIIPLDNNIIRIALVSILVLIHNIALRLVLFFIGFTQASWGIFFLMTLLEVVYTALLLPAAFRVFRTLVYPQTIE